VDRDLLQRLLAVVGHVDGHRLAPQAHRDQVGHQPLVVRHQHSHAVTLPGRG
jgi:hypothetical protein